MPTCDNKFTFPLWKREWTWWKVLHFSMRRYLVIAFIVLASLAQAGAQSAPVTSGNPLQNSESTDSAGKLGAAGPAVASLIPEEKTWILIGIGSAFMLWNLRRKRRV